VGELLEYTIVMGYSNRERLLISIYKNEAGKTRLAEFSKKATETEIWWGSIGSPGNQTVAESYAGIGSR